MGINYTKDTKKGYYEIVNKEKYMPSGSIPVFKSAWEYEMFKLMDMNPYILHWGYEPIKIPYFHPLYFKYTVYKPDIYCHIKTESGTEQRWLLEIKPNKYVIPPTKPASPDNSDPAKWEKYRKALLYFKSNQKTYLINAAKWEAAQNWCLKNNVMWKIFSEKNTGNLF